jgi:hypothetical protein
METLTLNNISELQNREKELHQNFPVMGSEEEKQLVFDKMRTLTETRIELFNALKTKYAKDVTESEIELKDQIATLDIVENELTEAKKRLSKMNEKYINKMRMVEITTYISDKYKAYNGLLKLFLTWFVIFGILFYISMRNPVPEAYISKDNSNTVFLVLLLVVGLYGLYKVLVMFYDIKSRSNMNFDEYDFSSSFDPSQAVKQHSSLPGGAGSDYGSMLTQEFDSMAKSLHLGCVDSSCCADGTMYDSLKKRCIPAMKKHKENTDKASLAKGSMGASLNKVENIIQKDATGLEGLVKSHVPFSSV